MLRECHRCYLLIIDGLLNDSGEESPQSITPGSRAEPGLSQGRSPQQAGVAAGHHAVCLECGRAESSLQPFVSTSAVLFLLHSLPSLAPGDWDSPH